MAYTALTFVSGEVLTATKMNLLAANDASFHDGTGLGDGTIKASKLSLTIQKGTVTGLRFDAVASCLWQSATEQVLEFVLPFAFAEDVTSVKIYNTINVIKADGGYINVTAQNFAQKTQRAFTGSAMLVQQLLFDSTDSSSPLYGLQTSRFYAIRGNGGPKFVVS